MASHLTLRGWLIENSEIMSKEEVKNKQQEDVAEETQEEQENMDTSADDPANADEQDPQDEAEEQDAKKSSKKKGGFFSKGNKQKEQIEDLEQEVGELKDKYIRLYAEFDNFRKRTARERLELMKTAGQDILQDLLPVLDDLDRAKEMVEKSGKAEDLQSGFDLIAHKLKKSLEAKGLTPMDSMGQPFDPEWHEAITEIPAPSEDMKGKVVDVIEKGYLLNDKIIRYAKVVVGK